jgi:MOSC domain-containing protein
VHIARIGYTPLKGGRHVTHEVVDLTADGPAGDRVFCLVDPARRRVLRTAENPALLRACARWQDSVLSVDLQGRTIEGVPGVLLPDGEKLTVDYWGRAAVVRVCTGPWAEALSGYLGQDVVLCRSATAGEVVYGASVTMVTTASMRLLSRRCGHQVDSARFRSTFLVDTGESASHVEDSWVGRELRVGLAAVRVRAVVPRCAVIDLNPVTGRDDADVLGVLAGYRQSQGEISFGVDAVVTAPGLVRTGDHVVLGSP